MDVENYWRVIGSVRRPPGLLELIGGVVKVGGHPNRFNHDLAVRHADRPTADIVAELRDHADSRKLSPPTTAPNLAFDILVHGQDVSIPLGLSRPMPRVAAGAGATRVWGMGFPFWARRRLRGYRLTPTEIGWSVGAGAEVRGPISAQLLLLTGRSAACQCSTAPAPTRSEQDITSPARRRATSRLGLAFDAPAPSGPEWLASPTAWLTDASPVTMKTTVCGSTIGTRIASAFVAMVMTAVSLVLVAGGTRPWRRRRRAWRPSGMRG